MCCNQSRPMRGGPSPSTTSRGNALSFPLQNTWGVILPRTLSVKFNVGGWLTWVKNMLYNWYTLFQLNCFLTGIMYKRIQQKSPESSVRSLVCWCEVLLLFLALALLLLHTLSMQYVFFCGSSDILSVWNDSVMQYMILHTDHNWGKKKK